MDEFLFGRLIFEGTRYALLDEDYNLADMAIFFYNNKTLLCDFDYASKSQTLEEYQTELQYCILGNRLLVGFDVFINNVIASIKDLQIIFDEYDDIGIFCEDILRKLLNESVGFLGDLKQGAFFASLHHFRALIELYASAFYCFSDEGKEKKALEKYICFSKAFFYQKLQTDSSYLGLSQEKINKLKNEYEMFKLRLGSVFDLKKNIKSWRGGLSIEDLLAKLPDSYTKDYEAVCHCIHFSPLLVPSKRGLLSLPYYWDFILYRFVNHVLDLCSLILDQNCMDEDGWFILIDNWNHLADIVISYSFEE